ncbi:MAG: CDP-glycerol glycerophosphotransferase family protein [Candidatus Marinimicrobia bacterium]|nr:CDP-glycerol glycerophosphotransferase family protein [Candidatus Neomarinimicrobiota bacterium]
MTRLKLDFAYAADKERAALLPLYQHCRSLNWDVRLIKIHRRNFFKGYLRRLAPYVVASFDVTIDRIKAAGWHGKTIYVDHGLSPVKYYAYRYKTFHDLDLLFYPGPVFKQIMQTINPAFENGLLGGLPKMDGLINAEIDKVAYCKDLKLDPSKPIVLFAPTWGGKYSGSWGIANARYIAGYPNLIIAPHPADYRLAKKFGAVLPKNAGNINDLIRIADLVVSDVSSVVGEAALVGKPVVQLILPSYPGCFPQPDKRSSKLWISAEQMESFARAAAPATRPFKLAYLDQDWILGHIATPENLKEAITQALSEPQRYKSERALWNEQNYWKADGKTNQRLAKMIQHFSETGKLKQLE